jgi:hypothetical protein
MNLVNFLPVGIASIAALAIALYGRGHLAPTAQSPTTTTSQPALAQSQTTQPESTDSPRRLTVTVRVSEPEDLKLKEGSEIKAGDIIASRSREKQRLESQKQQLTLSQQKLQSYTLLPPTPPSAVPAVKALPPISYLEQEAVVETAKTAISSMESEIETKKQEIAYLKDLPNLDPIVLEHSSVKLEELKRKHTAAVKDYQLALASSIAPKTNGHIRNIRHLWKLRVGLRKSINRVLVTSDSWQNTSSVWGIENFR